jgi:hypothetical protein
MEELYREDEIIECERILRLGYSKYRRPFKSNRRHEDQWT